MNTGEKIKYFRLARNMTQEQLAQEADISFSTLRKYEANERNPKYEQLSKIAAALEISVNIFMDFDIESVSDLLSILFKMESQADLEITTTKESDPSLSDDTLFLHFKNEYINSILRMYHLSVEDIKDMDIQQQEKALAEIQNRLLDNNSSIHSDNPISTDSKKSVLPLSSADQMWLHPGIQKKWTLFIQGNRKTMLRFQKKKKKKCSKQPHLQRTVYVIQINKSEYKKRQMFICTCLFLFVYTFLFTHEFPTEVHLDHGKRSFSFQYNHQIVLVLFQFLSHSILLRYRPRSLL